MISLIACEPHLHLNSISVCATLSHMLISFRCEDQFSLCSAVQCSAFIHSFKCWLCQCKVNLLQQTQNMIIAPVQFGFDPTRSNSSSSSSSLRFIVFHDQSLESDIFSSKIDTVMTRNFTCTTKVNRCIKLNQTSDSRQFILNNRACN